MKYKKYHKFKDSGVDWLGEIPSEWDITRLGNISNITASGIDKKINEDEEKVKIINFTDIHKAKNFILDNAKEYMLVSTPLERKNKHQVKKGDLIFTPSSETIEDIGISALVNEELLNTSYSYHVLRCNFTTVVNHEYKKYLTNNTYCLAQFSSKARGTTRQTLSRDDFRTLYLSLPPIQEQQQIAKFLDNATQKMDTLIQKQENLIKLLKEKRQAVISHAVTRGLNPDVKFKDSGVEWLGDVPKHWELSKLRFLFSFSTGLNITKANLIDEGIPCVNYGEIHSKYGFEVNADINALKCVDKEYLITSKSSLLSQGDFIFADTSEDVKGAGNFTHIVGNAKVFAGYHTVIARLINNYNSRFFAYVFDSDIFRTQIQLFIKGVKVFSITQAILKNCSIWFPMIDEQKEIAIYLDDKTQKIDKLIKKATKSIKLLKEKRTALISAAVTGKIDVRELN